MIFNIFVFVLAGLVDLSYQVEWSYEDEGHWPGSCQSGTQQSPINIITSKAFVDYHQYHIKSPLVYRGYSAVDVVAINNGHTLQWDGVPGSPPPVLSGGPLSGNYSFAQFHLHWLSEHAIDGIKYPLEIHMVHIKTGYTFEEASKRPDGLAVIGIMCQVKEHKNSAFALEEIMTVVPDLVHKTEEVPSQANIIDITRMFSPDPQSYYTYSGSLTTPHCNEAVNWIVMEQPINISDDQYKLLSRVDVGGIANFRNIQPTNRVVYKTATSCASLLVPGLLSFISALYHCSHDLYSITRRGICKLLNVKRRFLGLRLENCAKLVN